MNRIGHHIVVHHCSNCKLLNLKLVNNILYANGKFLLKITSHLFNLLPVELPASKHKLKLILTPNMYHCVLFDRFNVSSMCQTNISHNLWVSSDNNLIRD